MKTLELSVLYGGKKRETDMVEQQNCDVHYDTNNDGAMNPGECVDYVECPEKC